MSSTDGEYETDSFKSEDQVKMAAEKMINETEQEKQENKEKNSEIKRNQSSPINLSLPAGEKTIPNISVQLNPSPQCKHPGSPILLPPHKVAVLAVPPTVKVVPKEKKLDILAVITCSVSTQSTTTSTQQASIPDETNVVSSSVSSQPQTRHAITEISSLKPLKPSLGQGQMFCPPKPGDKPYVLSYYSITSDTRTIQVEVHSKEGKAKYQQVSTFPKTANLSIFYLILSS